MISTCRRAAAAADTRIYSEASPHSVDNICQPPSQPPRKMTPWSRRWLPETRYKAGTYNTAAAAAAQGCLSLINRLCIRLFILRLPDGRSAPARCHTDSIGVSEEGFDSLLDSSARAAYAHCTVGPFLEEERLQCHVPM